MLIPLLNCFLSVSDQDSELYPQFSMRIDIPEIKTESSFHSGVNVSKTNNKIMERFNIYRGQKFHPSARNYEWNLERTSNSPQSTCPEGTVLWEELLGEVILHITPLCSLLHMLLKDKFCLLWFFTSHQQFKGQVHVFAGQVKIVSHSSCRTSAIFKYFFPLSTKISNWKKQNTQISIS